MEAVCDKLMYAFSFDNYLQAVNTLTSVLALKMSVLKAQICTNLKGKLNNEKMNLIQP
jgi:ADP-glucose pyrophosphorylase